MKAAGITCGVLLLLMIIGGVMVANWWNQQKKNPNSIWGQSMKIATSAADGIKIQQAVVQYHTDNNAYPSTLAALTPKYLDAAKLHSDVDSNPSPTHVSWTYFKPKEGESPKTPLLALPYTMTVAVMGQSKTVQSKIVINLDGTSTSGNGQSSGSYGSSGGFEQSTSGTGGGQ